MAVLDNLSNRVEYNQDGHQRNMDTQLRYIRYRRKSSEDNKERQAASLEDQAYVLTELEKRYSFTSIGDLEESKSAHYPGRPVFNEMLEKIAKGEINAILVWHPNRLSRNALDAGQLLYLMDERKLFEIK